jgi:RNA polymerase-associated protein CTR9
LGAIEQQLGRATEAIEHYKEVFDSNPNDSKAWIMIGQAQATINEKLCKRSYEKVLKDCDKNNIYTHIALGNYHAAAAREMKQDKSRQQREESYKLAVNFYSQALRRDPTNGYAANGLAITIAEKGHLEQARDLFNQVRETTVSNASVWVNLAHIYVELKQFKQAIVMVTCLYLNLKKKILTFIILM